MKRYSSYKDSGVEWIGEIPQKWDVVRIGSFFRERRETVSDTDYQPLSVSKNGIVPQMEGVAKTENNDNRKLVLKGDFVINSRSDRKGSSGYSELDGSVSVINIVLTPNGIYPKYPHHLLKSYLFIEEFFRNGKGIVMDLWSTRYSEMKYMLIPLPPLNEQQQIVEYLDEKTSLIDTLIQSKQKKITLLKEKRTSLINQIVTKGLNPNVEMKDSGVEWIGEIPRGWVSTKFNRFVFFQEGPGLRTYQFTESGTKVICVTNITESGIDFSYEKFISTEEYLEKYQHFTVVKGDLLLSSSGNSWGKVSEYVGDEKVMLNTSTIRLNTLDEELLSKNLITHLLKSDLVRKQLEILMTGSCQPNFGPSHLNQLIIPIPPLSEQMEIVHYLDKETELIDKTVSIEERKIELLKEYKQSLISEVITGKRKVVSDE
jgi:type I restriction enzyme, S subunit